MIPKHRMTDAERIDVAYRVIDGLYQGGVPDAVETAEELFADIEENFDDTREALVVLLVCGPWAIQKAWDQYCLEYGCDI